MHILNTIPAFRSVALFLIALSAWLLSGCADPAMQAQFEEMVAVSRQVAAAQDATATNRLLVQDTDGNLYTVLPDGTERLALTADAGPRRQYVQPTWSPSGEQVGYVELSTGAGATQSALVVGRFSGLGNQRYTTPFAPFYLQWSPDESHIAYLSNWQGLEGQTIALRLVDLNAAQDADAEIFRTIAEGQPLYFAWSPEGTRILAHIGNERLEFRTLDGAGEALALSAAGFPAPQWSTDGSRLLYALGDGTGQRLVLAAPTGEAFVELTDYPERIAFALNAGGDRVAYVVTPRGLGAAALGPLYVVDATGNRTVEVSADPVLAFFWSPDGEKLAYLMVDDSSGTVQLRWVVWDGRRKQNYATFVPTRTFLQSYLAFFDQYARSMTIWAPDSSAFTYAALIPRQGPQVFVQKLGAETPVVVGRGVFVSWSPR